MVYGLTTAGGAVRKTDVMERSAASIRLSPGELDHLGPLLNVVGDVPSKVGRRASEQGRTAEVGKLSPDLWIGESSVDLIVELVDDFNGRFARGADTEPRGDLVTRQKIANGRHIGQRLGTRRRGHRQRAQLASSDVLDRRGHGGEIDLHLAAEEIGERRPGAAIGHVLNVDAGHHLEQLAGHMHRGSDAARRKVDLARISLRVGNNSGTLVTGTAGFTSITLGTRKMPATG